MTRLVRAELRKVWHSRFFLLAFAVLLSVNLFLLWFSTGHTPGTVPPAAYRTLAGDISGMDMAEMDAFLHNALARAKGLSHIYQVLREEAWRGGEKNDYWRDKYADDFTAYYDLYKSGNFLCYGDILSQEYRFLDGIVLEFEQANGYEEFLNSIEQKAKQLSAISIFANSASGYDMENIRVTEEAFRGMRGTAIQYYPQKGLMTALGFALTDVIAVFAMILIATVLVRTERDNGLLALIRATPAGRLRTAAAKLTALGASLFIVLLGLYGVNLAYCGALYGLGPLSRTIQSVPGLMRSTWKLTVGEYLGCFLLTKWTAAFVCGAWVMLAMLCARRLLTGALSALALFAANLLIRSLIPATSRWNVLKYANLVSLLRTNELLGGYRNLYWFDHPVPLLAVECLAALLFGALFLTAFYLAFSRRVFANAPRARLRLRWKLPRHKNAFTTPLRQETYKLFIMQGVALLLVLFAGFQIYTAVTTESYIDADEIYYQYYMKHIEGPLTREKIQWLNEQNEEFRSIYQLQAALRSGTVTPEAFQAMMQGYASLQQKMNVFLRVVNQAKAVQKTPGAQLVYETGWLHLLDYTDTADLPDTLWAAILCAIAFSGLFSVERQTGMLHVIGTTPLGRRYTVQCKLRLSLSVCAVLTALGLLPRFWASVRDYSLGTWLAPVNNIAEYFTVPALPLLLLILLMLCARFLATACMACVTLTLSQHIGNTFGALFASLLLFVLPPLLSVCGLTGAKWASLYPLFHVGALFRSSERTACFMLLFVSAVVCYLCREYLYEHFSCEKCHP